MLWAAASLSAGGELYLATDFKPEKNKTKYLSFKSFYLHMDTHAQARHSNEHYIELKLHN